MQNLTTNPWGAIFFLLEKQMFSPAQILEWLGIIWDSKLFLTTAKLVQVTGKIISLSLVLGNVTRLMTRYCFIVITYGSYAFLLQSS